MTDRITQKAKKPETPVTGKIYFPVTCQKEPSSKLTGKKCACLSYLVSVNP